MDGRDEATTRRTSSVLIQLLGRPRIERAGGDTYQFRSRKSWALLAYLILSERPPTRSRLASLLFAEADDPLRALRWNLAEIRRCLGDNASVDGDPLVLRLGSDVLVDVAVVVHGSWVDAVELPGLGADLLDGIAIREAAAFESWLLSERRRLAAAAEAILHEAALGSMSRGALDTARDFAVRAAAMSPLDENHQALLIRLYRLAGDDDAAEKQFAAYSELLTVELGMAPGGAVRAAMRERRQHREGLADDASIEAIVESGSAAVSAGAVEAGVHSLRLAVRLADSARSVALRINSRLVLAEALIHSLRGLDEEGLATLHEADRIAVANDVPAAVARARAELGYVDYLRARYDRAVLWFTDSLTWAHGSPSVEAMATTYLGCVESDRANYGRALTLLEEGTRLSRIARDPRREAVGLAMLGRVNLLRGRPDTAAGQLEASIDLAERDHWLSFIPLPQALQGELHLARDDPATASQTLLQAFARACQLGDPCWEGVAARGLALVAEAMGEVERAFELLADARTRCNRLADPYVWLDVHILDAQCELGRRHGHPQTQVWVDAMRELASRTGMKEFVVRSMLHAAALGNQGDAAAAALLATDIENPVLDRLLGA
ncbi:MAG TPA: BTAD domain-containing putative transcriptional regulator [Kribbella sp.]|nr:BTAD domain-containing putative transcriptional regulator [Kribbella sp.]